MNVLKSYPNFSGESQDEIREQLRVICSIRKDDISQFQQLENIFMSGRKVGKIPSSSADVAATDRIGDFNYNASYMYLLIDNGGAAWRRISLGAW